MPIGSPHNCQWTPNVSRNAHDRCQSSNSVSKAIAQLSYHDAPMECSKERIHETFSSYLVLSRTLQGQGQRHKTGPLLKLFRISSIVTKTPQTEPPLDASCDGRRAMEGHRTTAPPKDKCVGAA